MNRRNSYIVFVLFSNLPKTEEGKYNQDDRKYEFGWVQYRNQSGTKWDLWRPSPPLIMYANACFYSPQKFNSGTEKKVMQVDRWY